MQRKLMGLLIVMASSAFAQTSPPLSEDDPSVWAARAERAKSLKEEASRMRNAANAQRAQADLACRKKIFENACKNSARETWIEEINKVRAMEIEAVGLERNQRAHELAMREKERGANPPRPPLILPQDAAVSQPGAAPAAAETERVTSAPRSTAKPVVTRKRATNETELQQERERAAAQAAARVAQQKKDAARYAARASEHAEKEAARKAGKASSSAARSLP